MGIRICATIDYVPLTCVFPLDDYKCAEVNFKECNHVRIKPIDDFVPSACVKWKSAHCFELTLISVSYALGLFGCAHLTADCCTSMNEVVKCDSMFEQ